MVGRLVLTVDDVGALVQIDQAAAHLLDLGVITRAAAFPNGPAFASFASDQSRAPHIVPHLTLTYGCPLGPARDVRALLNARGQFARPLDFYTGDTELAIRQWCEQCFAGCDLGAAEREVCRQLEHFEAVTEGRAASLTFHHDIDAVVQRWRPDLALTLFGKGRVSQVAQGQLGGYVSQFVREGASDTEAVDHVSALIEKSIRLSKEAGGLAVEAVFHPATSVGAVEGFSAYSVGRVQEYRALRSDRVASLLGHARSSGGVLEFE